MAKNLLESYKNRLAISESVHQQSHNGQKMTAQKKLMVAAVLDNTAAKLNEAFESSAATQRSAMGDFKKFCLNVTTVTLPNLILPELMLTQPMTSFSGYITYLRFVLSNHKGGVKNGTLVSDPYRYGEMTEDRSRYTSAAISETWSVVAANADAAKNQVVAGTSLTLDWAPVIGVKSVIVNTPATTGDNPQNASTTVYATPVTTADGTIKLAVSADTDAASVVITPTTGAVTFSSQLAANQSVKVLYFYDNVTIPQEEMTAQRSAVTTASLPTLKAQMVGTSLRARARRIAIYYKKFVA